MVEKILEICKVTPSLDSPNNMSVPLCFFDLIWLRFQPVEFLFFYEAPSLSETDLIRLKNSLSLTLRQFLPLSGNLIWAQSSPTPIIHYKKGDGVLFIVAQSDVDFHHLSSDRFRETKIFPQLVPENTDSDTQVPILAIKITIFPNKGFCIGSTHHHVALDAGVFFMFCKLWASMCKLGESSNLIPQWKPIFDRNPIRERYPLLENLYINSLLNQDVSNPRSLAITKAESNHDRICGTFQLSSSDIKKLKEFVSNHEEKNCDLAFNVTTFNVTFAYIILCSAKARDKPGNKVDFGIVVDFRTRLKPPISSYYAGNCIGFVDGDVERDELVGDDGIIAAMRAIHKMRKELDNGVLKGAENWLASSEEELKKDNVSLAGSTNLDMYELDYGWGRPKKVDISSIDKTGAISLMKGRHGGVEIELCLNKHKMEKFASAFTQGLNKEQHIKAAL